MTSSIGFACHWANDPPATWSGTPWQLRSALAARVSLVDVGYQLPAWQRVPLKAIHSRYVDGRPISQWRGSNEALWLGARRIRSAVTAVRPSFLVEIQDLGRFPVPFGVVQDLSFSLLLENWDEHAPIHFPGLTLDRARRRRDRQRALYESAATLFPMSMWLADSLIASGVAREKVFVVPPGMRVAVSPGGLPDRAARRRTRLLLVGRDFRTKGGPQVVRALKILRKDFDPEIRLTVVGPKQWPMEGAVPEGVTFLGQVPRRALDTIYAEHDLFVMPSLFEGFGIAFVEALALGLPCIGRNACAMPEIIHPGVNGDLIESEDPGALAHSIAETLGNEVVYATCRDRAQETANYYSWDRAAEDIVVGCAKVGFEFDPVCNRA